MQERERRMLLSSIIEFGMKSGHQAEPSYARFLRDHLEEILLCADREIETGLDRCQIYLGVLLHQIGETTEAFDRRLEAVFGRLRHNTDGSEESLSDPDLLARLEGIRGRMRDYIREESSRDSFEERIGREEGKLSNPLAEARYCLRLLTHNIALLCRILFPQPSDIPLYLDLLGREINDASIHGQTGTHTGGVLTDYLPPVGEASSVPEGFPEDLLGAEGRIKPRIPPHGSRQPREASHRDRRFPDQGGLCIDERNIRADSKYDPECFGSGSAQM